MMIRDDDTNADINSVIDNASSSLGLQRSTLIHPSDDPLVTEPGVTEMDDTSRIAFGSPRFRTEQRVVNVISAENEIVPMYKQIMRGKECDAHEDKKDSDPSSSKYSSPISSPYCTSCYDTLIPPGYRYYERVRLRDVYIEWGGISKPFPSGLLTAQLDFEYWVTPGDWFELGKTIADVGFNTDEGYAERHDNEGIPCLWRVEDVRIVRESDGFPMNWEVECRNVEGYEPVMAWFREHIGEE